MNSPTTRGHPDHSGRRVFPTRDQQLSHLNKVEGQIRGIRKMIEQGRDCTEILDQIKAVGGALRQIQMGVLEDYFLYCLHDAERAHSLDQLQTKLHAVLQSVSHIA